MNVKTTVSAFHGPPRGIGSARERNVKVTIEMSNTLRGEPVVGALQQAFRGALDVVEATVKAR